MPDYRWLVLVWRLPTGLSTPRVTVWRRLRRLGAVPLTPGAAVLPYSDHLLEQFDWIADEIGDLGGDAWVLPVGPLPDAEEAKIIEQAVAERTEEYAQLELDAATAAGDRAQRALDRRLEKVIARDHFGARQRSTATSAAKRDRTCAT